MGERIRFPAEFEPHEAVWLAWPRYANTRSLPSEPVLSTIIETLLPNVRVELLVQDEAEAAKVRGVLPDEAFVSGRLCLHPIEHADVWMRDTGPEFLVAEDSTLRVLGSGFNGWGYEGRGFDAFQADREVARAVAERLELPFVSSPLVAEGGNHEHNGQGTMLASRAVAEQRNPDWTLSAIDAELRRSYGVEKIVWLDAGIAEDDLSFSGPLPGALYTPMGTGGHVDEFARFCDERTVILAEVSERDARQSEVAEISRHRLEQNHRLLERSRDAAGRRFVIRRIPMPEPIVVDVSAGDGVYDALSGLDFAGRAFPVGESVRVVAAASYLNFLVTNALVLMPTYWREGTGSQHRERDEQARAILEDAFPGRRVVGIDALALNLGGGGIHCVSQQQPTTIR